MTVKVLEMVGCGDILRVMLRIEQSWEHGGRDAKQCRGGGGAVWRACVFRGALV